MAGSGQALSGHGSTLVQLAVALVGHEGVGQLVEVAHQDAVELVQGELDPVIGDPVLLVVVGPDLLRSAAAADLAPPLLARARPPGGPARP